MICPGFSESVAMCSLNKSTALYNMNKRILAQRKGSFENYIPQVPRFVHAQN